MERAQPALVEGVCVFLCEVRLCRDLEAGPGRSVLVTTRASLPVASDESPVLSEASRFEAAATESCSAGHLPAAGTIESVIASLCSFLL